MTACEMDDCGRPRRGRDSLCKIHRQRVYRTGSVHSDRDRKPEVVGDIARIPLTQGHVAVIDAADLPLVGNFLWSVLDCGDRFYATKGSAPGQSGLMHRLLTGVEDGLVVDHRNGDGLDNRRSNLRIGVVRDNSRNLTLRTTSQSGYIGVGWRPDKNRWRAYVGIEGRMHHIGHFHTAEAAARARDDYVRRNAPSEFWSYNFPRPGEQGIRRNERESA